MRLREHIPMNRTLFTIPLLLAISASGILAQPVEVLTYGSIPPRIRNGNPTLAAARFRIDEAVGRMEQSGRLANPSFDSEVSHNVRNAEGAIEFGFSQKFPVTNRLTLEKKITAAGILAAEAEVRDVERLLIAEARAEYVKFISIRERLVLLERQRKLSEELAEFITGASERGEISSLDAAQAKLAALRIETEARRLRTEETAVLGNLKPLVGIAADAGVSPSGNLPPISVPSIKRVNRPDLNAARIGVDAAATGIELEQARRRDDIEASVFAAGERVEDAPDGLENEGIIGFKLSIPLPFWNDNSGNIKEATAIRDRKAQEVKAIELGIRHESQTALTEMQQWAALVSELNDTLLPLAEEQTKLLGDAYLQGQGNLQAVLTSREQTLELLASKIDAAREFRLARIRYEAALGQP
jgi:cobalt-zinc-cadmium efflux system outer membrane protein